MAMVSPPPPSSPSERRRLGANDDSSMDLGEEAEGRRNWDSAPADVLRLVLSRLPLPDAIRSSTVCKWWRSLVAEARAGQPELPWLWSGNSPDFYSLSDGRYYTLDLSRFGDWPCIGMYQDWLVLSSQRWLAAEPTSPQVDTRILYNPFSAARIQLPSITGRSVHKVVLSSPPDRDPDCRAAFVCRLKKCVGFCSVADGAGWNKLSCPEKFSDVVFYDNSLHAATLAGELILIDKAASTMTALLPPPPELQVPLHTMSNRPTRDFILKIRVYRLLVSGGDLLMLCSFRKSPLAVFKANFQLCRWEMAASLKGEAIFLFPNGSASMRQVKSGVVWSDAVRGPAW